MTTPALESEVFLKPFSLPCSYFIHFWVKCVEWNLFYYKRGLKKKSQEVASFLKSKSNSIQQTIMHNYIQSIGLGITGGQKNREDRAVLQNLE